jgi:hypothetical protein
MAGVIGVEDEGYAKQSPVADFLCAPKASRVSISTLRMRGMASTVSMRTCSRLSMRTQGKQSLYQHLAYAL